MPLPRRQTALAAVVLLAAGAGCGPRVDCALLCQRTLACEVSFAAPDDPTGEKITSGERSDEEACRLGCEESPFVTVESATCIDGLDTSDPAQCQEETLACLGYEP